MIGMRLSEAARLIGAEHVGDDPLVAAVCTDSRKLKRCELFIALEGPHFDGHDFLDEARVKGAAAAMVSRRADMPLPQIVVDDTREGLGRLAAAWRGLVNIPVVAVTGSNGKTTVKEMISTILARRGPVLATQGNLNNEVGLPLTLLRLSDRHRYAVLEMGANHPGEIAYLTRIARPTVGVVTNAGPAHLEGFGSIEGVARAKGELFAGLDESATAVINADDPYAPLWGESAARRRIWRFGSSANVQVSADFTQTEIELDEVGIRTRFRLSTPKGEAQVSLPLAGRHNVMNALAATAAALAVGAGIEDVRAGLEAMVPVSGRLELKPGRKGLRVIDDTYNANPASLEAGLDVLAACPGRAWLVLGDMGELGEDAGNLHRRVGEQAREQGVERLFALGELSREAVKAFGQGGAHFSFHETLAEAVLAEAETDVTVLVKGSRRMAMEHVVSALAAEEA
jgi:UDP-N-acetylmuramoyl-tripeptide--D-alanyl-D-alanine ligase